MSMILDESIVANNSAQAEAAIKKHEAISAEILARVCQFHFFKFCAEISIWNEQYLVRRHNKLLYKVWVRLSLEGV